MKRVLVFTKNKKYADTLYESLQEEAVEQVGLIHSNKSQAQRFNSVKQFQEGGLRVLIASDVIARGLDIKDISHVINFDMPEEPEVYIHRIGRTGRAQKAGEAISFINKPELLEKAEKLMGMRVQLMELPEEIEISQQFLEDERPFVKDKNVHKVKAISPSGPAFHEKKEKNKKVNKGGKRRQESKRRERIKMISKRKK